jgi:hypothetical protein
MNKMKTLSPKKTLEVLLIGALLAGSLQACGPQDSPGSTTETLNGSSIEKAIVASFDDIYAGTSVGKYVMYQGMVVNRDYTTKSTETYLSLVFQDEAGSRIIYAHCGYNSSSDASDCGYDGEVNAVYPIIEFDMQHNIPIRVYGKLMDPSDIHIKIISILRGPDDWDSFKLDP